MADDGTDGSVRKLAFPTTGSPYTPPSTTLPGEPAPYTGVEYYNAKTGKWSRVPPPSNSKSTSSSMMMPLLCGGVVLVAVLMMKTK